MQRPNGKLLGWWQQTCGLSLRRLAPAPQRPVTAQGLGQQGLGQQGLGQQAVGRQAGVTCKR
jgi:hypothetical protein